MNDSAIHAPTAISPMTNSFAQTPVVGRSRSSAMSAHFRDDGVGEVAERALQRLEVEAERRDNDAVDAEIGEPLHAVEVEGTAGGDLDLVRVAPRFRGALAHHREERLELVGLEPAGEEPVP